MLSTLRSRLTYANVIASLALFIALGGTSYAVATGSIDSREIKNNSVTGRDVRNSSLTGADVRNNRLTGADIRNDRLTGADVLESSLGKVPSAGAADTANTANSATTASSANTSNSANTANTLDGLDSTAFARVVATDTRNIDPPNLGSGSCFTQPFVGGPFSAVQPGDVALVFPFDTSFLTPEGFRQDTPGQVSLALCNFTSSALDIGELPYRIMVLR